MPQVLILLNLIKMKKIHFSSLMYVSMNTRNGFLSFFLLCWFLLVGHQWYMSRIAYMEPKLLPTYTLYVSDEGAPIIRKASSRIKINVNQTDLKSLTELSVPVFLAERWLKYLEKGGRFKKTEDVKKLYGMSVSLYNQLSNHLYVQESGRKRNPLRNRNPIKSRCKVLDINGADSTEWESLYGIGPYLAHRIIQFRQSLCGFVSVSQVKETYGLRDSVFTSILPCLTLKKPVTPCLSINYSTQEMMGKHPYIRFKLARAICLYRENNGFYREIEQLRDLPGVNDSIFLRIKPYLTIDEL